MPRGRRDPNQADALAAAVELAPGKSTPLLSTLVANAAARVKPAGNDAAGEVVPSIAGILAAPVLEEPPPGLSDTTLCTRGSLTFRTRLLLSAREGGVLAHEHYERS